MRNRAWRTESVDATECSQMNGRRAGYQVKNLNVPTSASFQGIGGHFEQQHRTEGSLGGGGNRGGQTFSQGRSPLEAACKSGSCSRGGHQPFKDHECQKIVGERKYFPGEGAGISTSRFPPQHTGRMRPCCSGAGPGPSFHRGGRADSVMDKIRSTPKSSVFSVAGDLQRNASGVMSHLLSRSKKAGMTSSLDTTSNANFPCSSQTAPVSKKQITLYGWYLMKPKSGDCTTGPSSAPGVAVGGYVTPQMSPTDFFQTARVEQRLERWKLCTTDGVEVNLMGMIDLTKSIANGFSPELVKYFLIGFPSTWIFMMLNLSSGGFTDSLLGLPLPSSNLSEGLSQDKNNIPRENPDLSLEANLVIQTATSLHTTPSQCTRTKAAVRKSSKVTTAAVPDGSLDVNVSQQCDEEPSDRVINCLGTDPPVKNSGLHLQTPSELGNCPSFGPEAVRSDGNAVGYTGEAPKSSKNARKSTVIMDVADLASDGVPSEDAAQVPDNSSQTQKTKATSNCPLSDMNVQGAGESLKNATTETAVADSEDLIVSTKENFDVSRVDKSDLAGVSGPCTPLHAPRQLLRFNTNVDNPPEMMDVRRKLRSGRHLPALEPSEIQLQIQNQKTRKRPRNPPTISGDETNGAARLQGLPVRTEEIVVIQKHSANLIELQIQNKKTRKRPRSPQVISGNGGNCAALSQDLPVREEESLGIQIDAAEPGTPEQVPCTLLQTTGKQLPSDDSMLAADELTTETEKDPATVLQNLGKRRNLRSGKKSPVADKSIQELAEGPENSLQNPKPAKRLRSSTQRTDYLIREEVPAGVLECAVYQPCSAAPEEDITGKELQQEEIIADSEALNRKVQELCTEFVGSSKSVMKKRHRKARNYYKSRRKTSCAKSGPPLELKQQSSNSSRYGSKDSKVGIAECHEIKETIPKIGNRTKRTDVDIPKRHKTEYRPKPRNRSKKTDQTSKSTSCNSSRAKRVQTVKTETRTRKFIIPPPLPTPRVADKSKVTEAFGLKISRFGRVLVPPLAVWCNQSITYDMDGSIIAISDGIRSEDEFSTGCYNFRCPSDKAARKLQRKLRKAAGTHWS